MFRELNQRVPQMKRSYGGPFTNSKIKHNFGQNSSSYWILLAAPYVNLSICRSVMLGSTTLVPPSTMSIPRSNDRQTALETVYIVSEEPACLSLHYGAPYHKAAR